jgi:DNA polymerase-3 subunit alpha
MKAGGQIGLFERLGMKKVEIKLEKTKPATKKEKLIWEKELLGLYVSSHPAEDFKAIFEKKAFPISKISNEMTGKMIRIGGIISAIKKVITRNGSHMVFAKLEDGQGKIEAVIFPSTLMKNPQAIKEHKAVLISGRVDNKDGVPKVICEDIEEIIES